MASGASEFDAARLAREAQVAREAFGFDDVEGEMPAASISRAIAWWIAGAAAVAGIVSYGLL